MIRDPRDILVSSYYSFGFSHGFSSVQKIKDIQKERRIIIQSKTIDEYALENSDRILTNFNTLNKAQRTPTASKTVQMAALSW